MSPEKEQKLLGVEQLKEDLTPKIELGVLDDGVEDENKIDLEKPVDPSELTMVEVATVSSDLLGDKKIIVSGNGSIKKELRKGMPNIENVSRQMIEFVTTGDGQQDRPSSTYHDVTKTFTGPTKTYWSDIFNKSKTKN